jgi:hypothetical protein
MIPSLTKTEVKTMTTTYEIERLVPGIVILDSGEASWMVYDNGHHHGTITRYDEIQPDKEWLERAVEAAKEE